MIAFSLAFVFGVFLESYVSTLDEFNGKPETIVKCLVWGPYILIFVIFKVIMGW